jgi:16S rRNA (guanine(1405)-N(7))-methyltransferase
MESMKTKLDAFAKDIIAKKELSGLDIDFVVEKIIPILKKDHKAQKKFDASEYKTFRKSKEYDAVQKKVRMDLRKVYGVFINNKFGKRKKLLEGLKTDASVEKHNEILNLHRSSSERLGIYGEMYEKIFEITGKPKKVLDLACGLNPLSFPYFECQPEYIAADLSPEDMEFVNNYFKLMKIKGKAIVVDLVKITPKELNELSSGVDVTFLFKTLDSLETVEWNSSKRVIDALNSNWIVISFATKSIGGKKEIKKEKRNWVEKYLNEKNLEFSEIELENEMFYVVKNKI